MSTNTKTGLALMEPYDARVANARGGDERVPSVEETARASAPARRRPGVNGNRTHKPAVPTRNRKQRLK